MSGVKETKVYTGPDGAVYRQDMLSGTQYHARTLDRGRMKGRYYATEAGARRWLARLAARRAHA